MRNKKSAGVLIIRAGGAARKKSIQKIFRISLTVPKIVAQRRKLIISHLYTMRRTIAYALPNAIAYLNTCIPYLNTLTRLSAPYLNACIAYLNKLRRLSAPYLNTCIAYLNTLNRLSTLGSIS